MCGCKMFIAEAPLLFNFPTQTFLPVFARYYRKNSRGPVILSETNESDLKFESLVFPLHISDTVLLQCF